jgi:hypothetical protein
MQSSSSKTLPHIIRAFPSCHPIQTVTVTRPGIELAVIITLTLAEQRLKIYFTI